jgi:hypothetical protein
VNVKNILFLVIFFIVSACASITGEAIQPISLVVKDANSNNVDGAQCLLRNDKGSWEAKSPGYVNVTRSADDLVVECKKAGYSDGQLKAISRARGNMWGNIVFGGGVGAIIDHSNGKGYAYPDILPVSMGKSKVIDRDGSNSTQ